MNIVITGYFVGVAISWMMGAAPADFKKTPLSMEEQAEIAQLQSDILDDQEDVDAHLRLGQIHFMHNNLETSGAYLQTAKSLQPRDPDVLAWWGSYRAKQGGAVFPWFWGFRKIALVKEGVRALDEAVQKSPHDPVIRLVRINTLVGLKGRFSSFERVFEDERFFTGLSAEQRKLIPDRLWGQIHLGLARAHAWKYRDGADRKKSHLHKALDYLHSADREDHALREKTNMVRNQIELKEAK